MSDLHKRIAQTIYDNCGMVFYRCEDVAKAIIDAHLRPERGELSSADGVMWAKDMGFYRCEDDPHTVHRWVTEWQADE